MFLTLLVPFFTVNTVPHRLCFFQLIVNIQLIIILSALSQLCFHIFSVSKEYLEKKKRHRKSIFSQGQKWGTSNSPTLLQERLIEYP